jgi:hypothetical protein
MRSRKKIKSWTVLNEAAGAASPPEAEGVGVPVMSGSSPTPGGARREKLVVLIK